MWLLVLFFALDLSALGNEVLEAFDRLQDRNPVEKIVAGKITFNFYGLKKCPLTDDLMKIAKAGINKADTIIGKDTIPSLEIDEWCTPGATGASRMNLGMEPGVGEEVVIHEYGHNYLDLVLGKGLEEVHDTNLKLTLQLGQAKASLLQKPRDCGLIEKFKKLSSLQAEFEKKDKYLLALHEYFADLFAITVTEVDSISGRNYRKKEFRLPWSKREKLKYEDAHYALEDIWQKSYELAKATFGNDGKKREFISRLVEILREDIAANFESYRDKPYILEDLVSRLNSKL
ncbi:MAG: hypothetical protein A4S09_08655 [Proteobacteria bacterium SG_bin7]|nr:MAG: hypothetical protein A4S09_08655 [Proteobacteria bacterium SG_bin7]